MLLEQLQENLNLRDGTTILNNYVKFIKNRAMELLGIVESSLYNF